MADFKLQHDVTEHNFGKKCAQLGLMIQEEPAPTYHWEEVKDRMTKHPGLSGTEKISVMISRQSQVNWDS